MGSLQRKIGIVNVNLQSLASFLNLLAKNRIFVGFKAKKLNIARRYHLIISGLDPIR